MMLGVVTDAEQAPEPCPFCRGTGWKRDTTLTPEYCYVTGDITIEQFEAMLEER
jgi:DnaJ-class molecular chaperone